MLHSAVVLYTNNLIFLKVIKSRWLRWALHASWVGEAKTEKVDGTVIVNCMSWVEGM